LSGSMRESRQFSSQWFGLLAFCCIIALGFITYLYVTNWQIGMSSDTTMIGLIAKSILTRNETPIYVWSVGYQGMLLEAYPLAALFFFFGISPVILNIVPAFYLWIALAIWTWGVTRTFSLSVAILALSITIFSFPMFYHLNMRTLPNFPETLLIGGLIIIVSQKLLRDQAAGNEVSKARLVLLGFLIGLGFYTFSIVGFFVFPVCLASLIIYYRKELRAGYAPFLLSWLTPWKRSKKQNPNENRLITTLIVFLSTLGAFICVVGITTLWIAPFDFDFNGRTIKSNALATAFAGSILLVGPKLGWDLLLRLKTSPIFRRVGFWIGFGLMIGFSPALYYKLILGGSSVKRASASGSWVEIEERIEFALHFHREFFNSSHTLWGSILALFFVAGISCFLFRSWKELKRFIEVRSESWPQSGLYFFAIPIVLAIFIVSKSTTDIHSIRYLVFLVPIYAVTTGWFICHIWSRYRKIRIPVVILYLSILVQGAYSIATDLKIERTLHYERILQAFEAHDLSHGYADYWLAYETVFLSNEKIILEPIYSNYGPYYGPLVRAQDRVGYVDFKPSRLQPENGLLQIHKQSYQIIATHDIGGGLQLQELKRYEAN
jgi:hypothetical protein